MHDEERNELKIWYFLIFLFDNLIKLNILAYIIQRFKFSEHAWSVIAECAATLLSKQPEAVAPRDEKVRDSFFDNSPSFRRRPLFVCAKRESDDFISRQSHFNSRLWRCTFPYLRCVLFIFLFFDVITSAPKSDFLRWNNSALGQQIDSLEELIWH